MWGRWVLHELVWLREWVWAGMGGKRACTFWPRISAFQASSPPIRAASRLSSLSKRCEVKVSEWLRLSVCK